MTLDITFDSDMHVDLIDFMGSDQRVVQAAQVSTKGAESVNSEAKEGLIRYLVNNRHASPTEHSVFTFLITAPIFVAREAHRHRIASLNEESGRYKELSPHFYVPGPTEATAGRTRQETTSSPRGRKSRRKLYAPTSLRPLRMLGIGTRSF